MDWHQLLGHPAWQAAGVIFTAVAIAVSIAIYFLQRGRKRLGFALSHESVVQPVAESYIGRLIVSFDGTVIDALSLAVVRITNIGTVPVVSRDFESGFVIRFANETQVLEAAPVVDAESLACALQMVAQGIRVEPLLLNPDERITIRVLREGGPCPVFVTARIAGIRAIENLDAPKTPTFYGRVRGFLVLISLGLGIAAFLAGGLPLIAITAVSAVEGLAAVSDFLGWIFLSVLVIVCGGLILVLGNVAVSLVRWLKRNNQLR